MPLELSEEKPKKKFNHSLELDANELMSEFVQKGYTIPMIAAKHDKAVSLIQRMARKYKWKDARKKYNEYQPLNVAVTSRDIRNQQRAAVWRKVQESTILVINNMPLRDALNSLAESKALLDTLYTAARTLDLATKGERLEEGQAISIHKDQDPKEIEAPQLANIIVNDSSSEEREDKLEENNFIDGKEEVPYDRPSQVPKESN